MQTLTTNFGRNLLVLDGFSFVKDKDGPLSKVYWKCIEFQQKQCRKRIHKNGEIVESIGIHSYPAEPEKI